MTITDWSGAAPGAVAELYARESQQWRDAFDWDTAAQWLEVETARTAWGLPGLLATDDAGQPVGWLFYLPGPSGAQLGGVSATTHTMTRALVAAFANREQGRTFAAFIPALSPGLEEALHLVGCETIPHLHLVASLDRLTQPPMTRPVDAGITLRPWRTGDDLVAAQVLLSSYARDDAALFAPTGAPDEWLTYVTNLVEQIGCGRFVPESSVVVERDGRPAGIALVTLVSGAMAHLAQIAVMRDAQGRGLGGALLDAALGAARAGGARAMSLLVSSKNKGAIALYRRYGFEPRGHFLEARGLASSSGPSDQVTPVG